MNARKDPKFIRRARAAAARFMRHRQHPLKMLDYTSRNLWLLLIPMVKYLLASRFNFQEWIRANWVDILAIAGIFALALLRWIFVRFDIESDGITAHTGFFGIVKTKIFYSQLTTVSFCQSWYSRPFKVHTFYAETNAKTVSGEDLKLVLSGRNADLLYELISNGEYKTPKVTYTPRKLHLMIFSLLFSSALTGVALYGTFMFEVYKILGLKTEQQMLRRVNGEFDKIDRKFLNLSKLVPRAVLLLGGIVLLCWFISFIATLARHWSFTVSRSDKQYFIRSGAMIKRRHIINRNKINYYDLTQSLLMKLFRICSVTLDCTGYGKRRREISAIIPITTYHRVTSTMRLMVPDLPLPKPEICTGTGSDVRRFVTLPALCSVLPVAAMKLLESTFAGRHREVNALLVIITVPLLWLVIVKAVAAFSTSVGFNERGCVMNYCRWYKFHKVFLPKENISKIRIVRNPMQMINHTCTLKIYTVGEGSRCHTMFSLPFEGVSEICKREGYLLFGEKSRASTATAK